MLLPLPFLLQLLVVLPLVCAQLCPDEHIAVGTLGVVVVTVWVGARQSLAATAKAAEQEEGETVEKLRFFVEDEKFRFLNKI